MIINKAKKQPRKASIRSSVWSATQFFNCRIHRVKHPNNSITAPQERDGYVLSAARSCSPRRGEVITLRLIQHNYSAAASASASDFFSAFASDFFSAFASDFFSAFASDFFSSFAGASKPTRRMIAISAPSPRRGPSL